MWRLAVWTVFLVGLAAVYYTGAAPDALSLNDAYSLMGFKSQIWNDPYASLSNWKVDPAVGHACFWNGIKCADLTAYRVSSIQLTGLSLVGPVASNIGALSELRELNLSNNGFTGAIPAAIGQCTKLTVLDLSHNAMSAVIPNELGSVVSLQKIYLGYNQFVGTLMFPSSLTAMTDLSVEHNNFNGYPLDILVNLKNIVSLNLGSNTFSGVIDSKDLTHFNSTLKELLLGSNLFQGPVPSTLSYLVGLEKLDLGGNNLTGDVPVEIQFCPNLYYVNMSYNQLTGVIPTVYNKLQSLSVLDLRGNAITGTINMGIMGCTNLTDLRLGENQLNGTIPGGFGNLAYLSYLDLSGNRLTGKIPAEIASLSLKTLNLSSNLLRGALLEFSSSLVELDLAENNFVGSIPQVYDSLPSLEFLSLAYNSLTGEIPSQLGNSAKLKTVNLTGNSLTNKIPWALASANMALFSVASNALSGEIPDTSAMRRFSPDGFLPGNILLCGAVIQRSCPKKGFPTWAKAVLGTFVPIVTALLGALLFMWLFPHGEYSAKTVRMITDDFNNTNLIGVGGMSTVYKGVFPDGNQVAVKRLRPEFHNTKTNSNFNLERKLLLDVKHPNIVQVLGSCNSGNLKVLILENMPNGNLDMHPNLPWSHRMDIAGGVAQALAYLHGEWQGANPMHCDLKASSVLLDEKFNAHITDVRLANQSSTIISDGTFSGSIGYMPPG
ncbi:LRR receptor-like serine/threonine-protein kinase GSO1 [Selaginella moellendorffii]|nr:LRR receptor-like serine/threonine-protein kinase GSO1 [Selaginella moellendorffii]|eukprot:XP_024515352.1 LRR receptor-like serine/threonine-protein kinase GSO1 [Selaginella moellendorffii]